MMRAIELPPPRDAAEFRRRLREERREQHRASTDRRLRLWGRRISDVSEFAYTGCVRVVQFPFVAVDLLDRDGRPDHTKILPFITSQELIALQFYDVVYNHRAPSIAVSMLIASLAFGFAGYKVLLKSKAVTVAATESSTSTAARKDERSDTRTDTRTETITREYVDAHYTSDGVPKFSLPPKPNATTPSGEG